MVVLSSAQTGVDLPATEIFKKAREKYAGLTSYSDTGSTVSEINGTKLTTTFRVKLARPDLYLVEWEQAVHPTYRNQGAVWSAGEGDFLRLGNGTSKQKTRELGLASATGVSGSAAATIPGTFFRMNWGNQLGGAVAQSQKQPDGKAGGVDCYVFRSESRGRTTTLYIGKQDFLIRQLRTVTSSEAMKDALARAAKSHPEVSGSMTQSDPQGIVTTETHENIVVDQKFSKADFVPNDAGK